MVGVGLSPPRSFGRRELELAPEVEEQVEPAPPASQQIQVPALVVPAAVAVDEESLAAACALIRSQVQQAVRAGFRDGIRDAMQEVDEADVGEQR